MLKVNPLIRKTQSIIRFSVLFVAIILACFSLSNYLFAATPEEERENELLRDHISGLKKIITSQVDVKVQIARNLALVRRGSMSAEICYKSLARLEMPRGKEARHMLNEVKKDIANALGAEGKAFFLGAELSGGGTDVEMKLLTWRRDVAVKPMNKVKRCSALKGSRMGKFSQSRGEVITRFM